MAGLFTQKSAESKSPKKYFSYFILDDSPGIRTQAFASNKPTHYILDHGDFQILGINKNKNYVFLGEKLSTNDNEITRNWHPRREYNLGVISQLAVNVLILYVLPLLYICTLIMQYIQIDHLVITFQKRQKKLSSKL